MENPNQPDETNIPDWVVAFTLGNSQAHLERIAASFAVSSRNLAARLGALLQAPQDGVVLGSNGTLPQLRRGPRARHSLPQSLEMASHPSGSVRENEAPQNGKLVKGAMMRIVLGAMLHKGRLDRNEFVEDLKKQYPDVPLQAFHGTLNRSLVLGRIKKTAAGKIKLTSLGAASLKSDSRTGTESPIEAPRKMKGRRKMKGHGRPPGTKNGETTSIIARALEQAGTPLKLRRDVHTAVMKMDKPGITRKAINHALQRGVLNGVFIKTNDGYKLSKNKTLAATA
jgi:hypothetical protein